MSEPSEFQLEQGPPSPEAMEIARKELREIPEIVEPAIKELRALIEKDETLNYRTDDAALIIFLRPCKFYAQSAYELMVRIADFKVKYAASIGNVLPDDEKSTLIDHAILNLFKTRDQHRRRVLVANLGTKWDTKAVTSEQVFRLLYLIHVLSAMEPETQIRGSVVMLDFEGLGMKQVTQLTPSFSMRLLTFIQDAITSRLKEVHIVRQPFIFNIVWKVFTPFIKQKLRSRIHFHGTKFDKLHEMLGKSHLPADYGGDLPMLDYTSKEWYPAIKGCEDQIREWNSWGRKTDH